MTTLNILLPETLQSFVKQQVELGGYSNVSEYILYLILQEQAKAAQVEALLLEGLDSGEPIEVTDEWWEQKRTQLMQGLQQTQEWANAMSVMPMELTTNINPQPGESGSASEKSGQICNKSVRKIWDKLVRYPVGISFAIAATV